MDAARDATSGGKRLRPAFCYWGFRAAGGDPPQPILTAAASLEMLHVSALVHDDVMDGSDVRRGAPAAHRRFETDAARADAATGVGGDPVAFGIGAAILLGDLCLVWADELLHTSGSTPPRCGRAAAYFDAVRGRGHRRAVPRPVAQASGEPDMDRALRVLRFKSAKYTVERPLHIGAALAGARARTCSPRSPRTGCRSGRRSSSVTTCWECSATRRRPENRRATTCARASGRY